MLDILAETNKKARALMRDMDKFSVKVKVPMPEPKINIPDGWDLPAYDCMVHPYVDYAKLRREGLCD